MVGGSTTECLYLDDSESITSVLQQRLNDRGPHNLVVRVYGASKSGDATDDHISMIAHRLVHLEPDMLIVFSGINDLSRSIYNYDYSHYSSQASLAKYSLVKLWATEFQISRRVYLLLKRLFPPAQDVLQTITGTSNYREKIRIRESVAVSNERPRTDLVSYATNLRTIIGIAKSQGIPLVFMTQQTTWDGPAEAKKWHWMVHRNGVTYRDDFMNEAMESLNDAMRELAIENDIPLYDLARSMPKSLDLMYDDVHFTERGAALAAEELASLILEKQMIRRAGTDVAVRSNPTE
jgi:lysophospholipase L1-like esterase